jgi:hypothetical protein
MTAMAQAGKMSVMTAGGERSKHALQNPRRSSPLNSRRPPAAGPKRLHAEINALRERLKELKREAYLSQDAVRRNRAITEGQRLRGKLHKLKAELASATAEADLQQSSPSNAPEELGIDMREQNRLSSTATEDFGPEADHTTANGALQQIFARYGESIDKSVLRLSFNQFLGVLRDARIDIIAAGDKPSLGSPERKMTPEYNGMLPESFGYADGNVDDISNVTVPQALIGVAFTQARRAAGNGRGQGLSFQGFLKALELVAERVFDGNDFATDRTPFTHLLERHVLRHVKRCASTNISLRRWF